MKRALAWILLLAIVSGTGAVRAHLESFDARRAGDRELLYLPNGKYLKALSLGHPTLLADLVYLWAIQYYSDYRRAERSRYVQHVFGEVIAELDPHYVDPYWLGALILIVENRDLDGGLRLLDRGFENNPTEWILPYLAGWECYRAREFVRAASYFDRASRVPEAPSLILRVRAGMYAKAGDPEEAIRMWKEVLDDARSDGAARAVAARQIRDLEAKVRR